MPKPKVLALCYHAVSDRWDAALSVTPDDLRRQLGRLVSLGWVGATFSDAVLRPVHDRTLAVTFDDAFDSVRTLAAPILTELGLPGTVFAATDWVGRPLGWPEVVARAGIDDVDELRAMSWDDLRGLAARGWEIGAHTCSHPHLPALDPEAILDELARSRAVCEQQLGMRCRSVAYPFGEADDGVRAAAALVGYEAAAGLSQAAFVARDPLDWWRVGVWHGEPDWRFDLKVLPLTAYLRGPAWGHVDELARRARTRARARARERSPTGVSAAR